MPFDRRGLLVSIPARELAHCTPSGSVFLIDELRKAPLSHELRAALRLAEDFCAAHGSRLRLVARPEIFTHGASLAWLLKSLGGIRDHLCISDGSAVRPVPTLRNHLFLYRPGAIENARAFERLSRFAPELLATFDSQVNTCQSFRVRGRPVTPPTLLLQARTPSARPPPKYYAHVHHASLDTSVERILGAPARVMAGARSYEHLTYVPMTEAAVKDESFARKVAEAIGRSYVTPASGVMLRLPRLHPAAVVTERLKAALEVVRAGAVKHPHLATPSVLFATEDPSSDSLTAMGRTRDLMLPSSFEFWHHPVEYYAGFRRLQVIGTRAPGSNRGALRALLKSAFGRDLA